MYPASLTKVSLTMAASGIVLIYLFFPGQQQEARSVQELRKDCFGPVDLEGTIQKVFHSSNGKLIGELKQNKSTVMVFLGDSLLEKGTNVSVTGKASKFSNQCWIFSERVEVR